MTARAAVAAMTAYTLEHWAAAVKLNQNESPFDVPAAIKADVLERLAALPWNRYPDFEGAALRHALAETWGLDAEGILTGNGSNELLAAACATFVGPGVPVVYPRPGFALYEKLITIAGGLPVPVDLDPATGLLPVGEMAARLDRLDGAVAIVCSPNNPTGGVLPPGGLDRLLGTGATVLYDRAYGDFDGLPLPPLHERLITFSTFSKAWGLAALRVGWLVSTPETCREIRKVKLPYSLNVLSEAIAIAALQRRDLRDRNVSAILAERARLFDALARFPAITAFPSAANFIAFRSPIPFREFRDRGVLVRDLSSSPGLSGCLRVTVGSPEENDRFLGLLQEVL